MNPDLTKLQIIEAYLTFDIHETELTDEIKTDFKKFGLTYIKNVFDSQLYKAPLTIESSIVISKRNNQKYIEPIIRFTNQELQKEIGDILKKPNLEINKHVKPFKYVSTFFNPRVTIQYGQDIQITTYVNHNNLVNVIKSVLNQNNIIKTLIKEGLPAYIESVCFGDTDDIRKLHNLKDVRTELMTLDQNSYTFISEWSNAFNNLGIHSELQDLILNSTMQSVILNGRTLIEFYDDLIENLTEQRSLIRVDETTHLLVSTDAERIEYSKK